MRWRRYVILQIINESDCDGSESLVVGFMYMCIARARSLDVIGVALLAISSMQVPAQGASLAGSSSHVRPAYPARPNAC